MLVERDLQELADNREYIQVLNYFHSEYTDMLRNFLKKIGRAHV